ncbi:hypothetical protein [Paucibacter sp. KBW04]|uniref:hypothetical protein n=1 Tax=Paucibacter sp. KBW04 TaxID=2153361 RepID=UPI000F5603E6|nr:hypothetical protein [Paucibacter sp. KBW04]
MKILNKGEISAIAGGDRWGLEDKEGNLPKNVDWDRYYGPLGGYGGNCLEDIHNSGMDFLGSYGDRGPDAPGPLGPGGNLAWGNAATYAGGALNGFFSSSNCLK